MVEWKPKKEGGLDFAGSRRKEKKLTERRQISGALQSVLCF